ncbi:MAG: MFS transporter [Mycobacteriales bacterium]
MSAEAARARRLPASEAFSTASLRRLHLSWAAASTGAWTFMVALAVYAYDVGGAAAVGLVGFARMVPAGVLAPFAGLVADRWSRRRVLLAICVGRAAALAVLAGIVALDAPLAYVLVLAAAVTVLTAAHTPSQAALLTLLAPTPRQLAACNGVVSSIGSGGFLIGSLLGGALVAVTSPSVAFATTTVAFALAVVPLLGIPPDPVPPYRAGGAGSVLAETVRGVREVAGDRSLRLVVGTLTASTLIEGALDVLVVIAALSLVDLGPAGVGWLNACWGIGGLVGGGGALVLLHRGRYAAALSAGGLLAGAAIVFLAAVPVAVVALAALVVVGVGYAFVEVSGWTLLQRQASDEVLARAFGVAESAYWSSTGVGALLAPAMIPALGARGALATTGGALLILLVAPWRCGTSPARRLSGRPGRACSSAWTGTTFSPSSPAIPVRLSWRTLSPTATRVGRPAAAPLAAHPESRHDVAGNPRTFYPVRVTTRQRACYAASTTGHGGAQPPLRRRRRPFVVDLDGRRRLWRPTRRLDRLHGRASDRRVPPPALVRIAPGTPPAESRRPGTGATARPPTAPPPPAAAPPGRVIPPDRQPLTGGPDEPRRVHAELPEAVR